MSARNRLLVSVVLLGAWCAAGTGGTNRQDVASDPEVAAVTNSAASATNAVAVGTNTATRVTESKNERDAGLLGKLARAGTGLLEEGESGDLRVRERDPEDASKTVTLDSRWLGRLGVDETTLRGLPPVRTSVGWDPDEGTRDVRKIEFGLFNDVFWLMHEPGDDEDSVTGFLLRGKW